MVYLSIVIPAYNEEHRIGGTLSKIHDFLSKQSYTFEVILVDDGSIDNTVDVAKRSFLYKENKLNILENGNNMGKGFSVRNGISASSGEYILFTDADMSTPIEEIDKLFSVVSESYDIAIGSRALKDSNVKLHQPWFRETMGRTFNVLVKLFLMKDINDTQCGFKLFRCGVAKKLASEFKINGFSFDVEMLYLALKKGYKIKEVPIAWLNSPKSKVNPLVDSTKMFFDLIKIKAMHG